MPSENSILKPGDQIGIIAPSGSFEKTRLVHALEYFKKAGYKIKLGKHIYKRDRYLAGSAQERADDIHDMFRTKSIKSIFAARGGFGATQVLPLLDYKLIQNNPKPLFGFSDTTALQLALWEKSKLSTISGLALCADISKNGFNEYTKKYFEDFINTSQIAPIQLKSQKLHSPIRGKLIGGCLTLVVALSGTNYQPQFKDRILFLEDVKEEPYRIDRLLTQLSQQNNFNRLKAIIFGKFFECKSENPKYGTIEKVLQEFADLHQIPVFTNLPYGHQPDRCQVTIGQNVTIDQKSVLRFEPFQWKS